ncbi:MAG: hypothetical protein FWC91_12260 [Defluviitaleaceae bacterium]|nr:hypothetical protein [Defluviitaleaceae bacterium]
MFILRVVLQGFGIPELVSYVLMGIYIIIGNFIIIRMKIRGELLDLTDDESVKLYS